MRIQPTQIERLVRQVIERLKAKDLVRFKKSEKEVFDRAVELVVADFKKEDDLVREVNQMLDDLEKTNPGGFERHKMFGLLKKKLAKEKGVVL